MTDFDPVLRFASFKVKDIQGIPENALIPAEFYELARRPLPQLPVSREYQLIAEYNDYKKVKLEQDAINEARLAAERAEQEEQEELDRKKKAEIPSPPHMKRGVTAEDAFASKEMTVAMMMEETKEQKDVCIFFLESTDWDLPAAIELLKSMNISN